MKKTLYILCSAAMALLMAMPTWAADPEPDQFTIVNHRLCEGDSLLIRDGWKKIKETTVFWETLKSTVTGEDSMIKHIVNVLPTYRHIEEKTIKDGETYTWNGQNYNQQGEYTYPLHTVEGCDSICVLRLIVTPVSHPIPFVEESGFVCQPEGYLWRGVNRYVTGTYYDTVHNVSGEDTIYCLRLQAYPVYETFQPTVYFCDGDSLTINGQVFKQSGQYRDTVKSIHGCDSILIYPINKYPAFHYNEERTIQTGDMLLWHGQSLQSEGTYYDKQQTVHGCDSIYILLLHVNPATRPIPLVETFAETCRQDGYVWRDKTYYSEGIYYDTIRTGVGEDTIYCLHLTIYPTYELHQTLSFCQGGSIEINGHTFTQPGEYRDTLNTIHGCDSIIIYHLNTYPVFQHTEEQTIQAGDVLIWRGQTLQSEGTYYDKYQTIYGCDSIYTLILHVNPAPRPIPLVETFAGTCKQEGYEWRGHLYFNEGVYYDTIKTGTGEDTIYCLHLTVHPTYELHQTLSFCQGSSLEFRGKKFTEPGEYRDTLNSIYGCDSIIIYHINTYPTFHQYDTIVITDQDQRIWHGQQITESKTYYDSYTDIHGCDSIYELYAIILPTYRYVLDTTICKNALPFLWRGQEISAGGTYTQKYESIHHTDSIYILNLTVHPTYWSIQNIHFCEGGEVTYAGKTYHQAGKDTLFFESQYGCDSIVEVLVSERKKWMQSDTLRMSNQESRDWHGYHITKSGTYYDRLTNVDGCDSVYELVVYVFPTFLFEKDTAICQSEAPYLWQGMECSRLGTHTYDTVFKTIHGLDSIYRLTLTIWPEYEQTQQINICKGGSLEINGHIFTEAGEYRDTMRTIHGCDSVITYHVNMYPYFHHFDTIIITDQETYTWHGQSITTTGTYFDVNTDKHGCDSIYELFATVLPTYRFTLDTTVCQSTLPFTWRGKEIGRAGTYTDPLRSIYNTDSIYVLNVSLLPSYWNVQNIYFCEGGDVTFGGKTYTKSCRDTIRYGSSLGCDSVIEVVVNERRAWIQSDTVRMSNQETKLWRGQTITTSGIYYDRYNSVDGCDSIFELVVFVYPTYLFEKQVTICQSEAPYIWRGRECSRLGTHTYEEVFKTIYGLDSIYRLTLTIWPEYEQTLQFNVCEGSYIEFEGNQCVSPGQYDFTLKTIHGCDSVIHVIVNSVSSYLFSDTVYINDYTPYTWPITGETYSEAGVYTLPGSTTDGCDSSYQLIIYKYPKYIMPVEQVELCMRDTDSFMWRGNEYNQTGVYYDSLFTEHGQDSIYTLNLVVHPIYDTIINATICYDAAYLMNGKPYTASGTYQDILPTVDGCDSVFTLNLTVLPQIKEVRFDTICETALPYTFYDQTIWTEGTYTYQFQGDQNGCNSTSTLHLSVRPVLNHNDSIIICHQDIPYILGDTSGERGGIKLYNDTVVYSCDSLYHFRLHVRGVKDSVVTMCDNDSLWLAGVQRWIHPIKGEVYYDTILSAPSTYSEYDAKVQCDSVIRYTIEGTYPSFNQDTIVRHINEQDSLFWAGQYRKSEGFYYDTLQTAACHCDSIITLHLIVDPIYVYWDSIHICQPHDIAYRHIWADGHEQNADIWQPGTYIDSLRSVRTRDLYNDYDRDYRDSIYVLVVTMDPSYFFNSVYQLCQGDSVQFGSQWIYEAGVYTDSMKTYLGCDSIYRMVVNMTPSYYIREQKSIAQGTIYQWHGQSLSVPGIYYDSLKTQMYDCDSIYELTLDVYPTYHFRQDTAICACETPFLWHGQMIYTSGQYFDRHQTVMHFDSIYELNLQVRDTFHVTDLRTGCKGDSIYFNRRWITIPGEYYDTLKSTVTGCDSIVRLIYSTFSTYFIPQVGQTDDQTPFVWEGHGKQFTQSGVYYDSLKTVNGCDSVYQLTLTVYPTYNFQTEYVTICATEAPYYWEHGHENYSNTGTYTKRFETVAGYDSIYTLDLTVLPVSRSDYHANICDGDSVIINNIVYKNGGLFYDTLKAVNGCDSIVAIHIARNSKYFFAEQQQTNDQTPFVWEGHDKQFTQSGIYYDSLKTINGCDSVYQLTLTVYPTYNFQTEYVTICATEAPYYWEHGHENYSNTGTYTKRFETVAGYDSIYTLDLTVLPVSRSDYHANICDGDSVIINNIVYKNGGLFYDTLKATNGCDSIVAIHIARNSKYFFAEQQQTNDQTPFVWEGHDKQFTQSGIYYDSLKTINGCDSVYQLTLTVYPTYNFQTEYVTICATEAPYYWEHGHENYSNTGTYTKRFETVAGYDSIYTLDLTVLPVSRSDYHANICDGDSVIINNIVYKNGGLFYDTLKATNGCDSIVAIHIARNSKYFFAEQQQTNDQTPFVWEGHDKQFTQSGIYYDSLKTINGCDSVYQLTLTVYPTYNFQTEYVTICATEAPYYWEHGHENYSATGTYTKRFATVAGYDSIYTLDLTVLPVSRSDYYANICDGDSVIINNIVYKNGGLFYDTLKATNGCDSIVAIHIARNSKYFFAEQQQTNDQTPFVWEGHDKQFTQSGIYYDSLKTVNGCDSVYQLTLTVYPTYNFQTEYVTICATEAPYYWEHGHENYSATGTYTKRFATVAGYDSIYTLDLTVLPVSRSDYHANICDGDSVIINNIVYKNGGLFYDTLKAVNGCDSIMTIHVTKSAKYFHHEAVSISESELPYTWAGHPNVEIPYAGTFYDYQHTVNGCDSIFEIVVTAYKEFDYSITVCENELPYMLAPNKPLMNSGIYVDTLRNVLGQDSLIRRCKLIVYPVVHTERTVQLCQGSTYTLYNGRVVSVGGNYNDTLQSTVSGCDSIVTIHLSIAPAFDIKQDATIYEGDSILFEGEWLKTSGLYRKSYTSIYGCDSTIQLNLTVRPIYNIDTTVYICDYELPYEWNGELFYDAGDYTRAKESLVDKVFTTLHLIVGASYYEQRTIDICQGDTIAYRNKIYFTSGVFYDTIPTTAGCDSIFQITVRVMKTYYNYLTVNISDKETYVFGEGERARILNKEGTYFNYDKTAEGCDSITELTLHVHPSYFFQEDMDICQNELPYDFHGRQIWETGVYYDSLLTKQGYDSVYMLNLIVHPTYLIEEAHDICPDRTTYIHGLNISQPGVYYDSLTTHHGCDSVYKIVVNWRRTYEQEYSAEICQGEAYDFYGVSYTRTGTYKYKIGCDSIIILHLVVHESTMTVFNELVCPEDMPFFFHGKEYEQAGVYCDTFKTIFGCDSIVKLNLTVSNKCSQWNRVPLCKDDTIFILGDTLCKAGEYQFKSRSSSGLVDSIYRIELYNAPVYERNLVDSMCQGDTMWIGDQPITRSGLHHIYLKTTEGCDSIIHLSLTVFPSYLDRTNATIADYQTYNWRGVDYNVTGIYDYVLPTIHDCDSTFRLDLYVVPTQRPTSDAAICSGSTYTWRGRVLSEPGTYTDTILNLASYTSVIYTLNLTVEMPTEIISARLEQDEVCADDDEVQISFIYNGAKPSNYSILFDSRALKEGFTNIHNQPFGEDMLAKIPLPKRTDPAYLEHSNYVRPDMYYLRMVLESQVCGNSQSDTLSFMVRYPSWLLEQNWSDVVALLSSTYNGGYQFSQYDWYVNGARITNAGNSYLYLKDLRPGDQVYVSATREGENYSITSCPITIVKPEADKYPHPILVYPSSAPKKMPCVTIQSTEDGQFDVYSQTGQAIQHGTVVAGEQIVTMPAVSGCYILKAATKDGQSTTQKIIIF